MKRFLRYYLPSAIILLSLAFWALFFLIRNPLPFEYCVGWARLHSSTVETRVFVNGIEYPEVKVYSIDNLDGRARSGYLMYADGVESIFPALFIDEAERDIGMTNFTKGKNYEVYFDRFLLQSHTAYAIIWASDKVKWGHDPEMEVTSDKITFYLKPLRGDQKIEIFFTTNKN
jgi:hypothetical protein